MTGGRRALRNVDGLLRRQADEHPDTTALVDGSTRLSWRGLDQQVEALARGLAELGLVAGHRVAIVSANSAELVVCYLAVLRGGMVAVPVNPTSRPGEIGRVLADSGARVSPVPVPVPVRVRVWVQVLAQVQVQVQVQVAMR